MISIPEHWEVVGPEKATFRRWSDDGRDMDKPVFLRKDGRARIYYNKTTNESNGFGVIWDELGDGDHANSLEEAFKKADDYLKNK